MIISKGPLYALNVLLFYQKDFHPTDSKPWTWNRDYGVWFSVGLGVAGLAAVGLVLHSLLPLTDTLLRQGVWWWLAIVIIIIIIIYLFTVGLNQK